MKTFALLLLMYIASGAAAQEFPLQSPSEPIKTKYEREYRIKPEEVPLSARSCVDSLFPDKKVRWYFEENLLGNSVEAKLKHNKTWYSIEFDTLGALQDIEVLIPWEDIPLPAWDSISANLDARFTAAKIQRVQRQYAGADAMLLFQNDKWEEANYEIVVKGKTEEGVKLYEIGFDAGGEERDFAEIIFRNTDNLEY